MNPIDEYVNEIFFLFCNMETGNIYMTVTGYRSPTR
jgi:hypothetical protein